MDSGKQRVLWLAPPHASSGMVLARSVRHRDGSVLVPEGTVLDSELIQRMIQRGARAIQVRVPDQRDEKTIAREVDEIRTRIETIFRDPGSAIRDELRSVLLANLIENAQ